MARIRPERGVGVQDKASAGRIRIDRRLHAPFHSACLPTPRGACRYMVSPGSVVVPSVHLGFSGVLKSLVNVHLTFWMRA